MAGSFAQARAQVLSLRPEVLRTKAEQLRQFGIDARLAGSQLAASADEVGSQRGAPYAAYQERVSPTAAWLRGLESPVTTMATGLDEGAAQSDRARMVLAQQEAALDALARSPGVTPAAYAAAEAQALTAVNQAIDAVSRAYAAIAPPPPGTAPVVAGGAAGTGPGAAGAGRGAAVGTPGLAAGGFGGTDDSGGGVPAGSGSGAGSGVAADGGAHLERDAGAAAALGPQSGPFAGFVQDPLSGNLIDPGTGREVDAGGRFLDPVTGQPFGQPAPFATRLEGLVGGGPAVPGLGAGFPAPALAGGVGVPPPGVLGPSVGAGVAPAGPIPAGSVPTAGAGSVAGAGVVPFLPPGAVGAAGPGAGRGGGRGGVGRFAALYGGTVPPSLAGSNPANGQLQQIAAQNLERRAAVAQRYTAIATGQPSAQAGYLPPPFMAAGGAAGAARPSGRGTARTVTEPSTVWGAVPGARGDRRRTPVSADTEDADVWTGGPPPTDLLHGR